MTRRGLTWFNGWLLRRWPWSPAGAAVVIMALAGLPALLNGFGAPDLVLPVLSGSLVFVAARNNGRLALVSRREGLTDDDLAQVMTHLDLGGDLDPRLRGDAARLATATQGTYWYGGILLITPIAFSLFILAGWAVPDRAGEWVGSVAVGAAYAGGYSLFTQVNRRHRNHLEKVIAVTA